MSQNPQDDASTQSQATMRIDITPAMLEQLQQAPVSSGTARIARGGAGASPYGGRPGGPAVIRIPSAVARPLGGEDFQVLLQSIYDAVFITDPSGNIQTANARAEHFFQTTRAEFRKTNVFDWLCGAERSLLDTILATLQNNRFVLIQALCQRTDETMFPAEISVSHLKIAGQQHLSFFLRDITVRREREERLQTGFNALQNAGGGIAVADVEGVLAGYVNPSMMQLLGLASAEEAMQHRFDEFMAEPALMADMLESAQQGDTWAGELEMRRMDGTPFFAQAALAPNLNPDGAMTGIVISLVDVTPARTAQQQLEHYATQLRQKNEEMEADLRMARDLQYAFLPAGYPSISGPAGTLSFAHVYHPSGLVGGDFFSLLKLSPDRVMVFVADVMGHGVRASLVVATLRGLLEQIAKETQEPGEFLTRLNAAYFRIFGRAGELMFATACCMRIDMTAAAIAYAHAGHPLPIVASSGTPVHEAAVPEDLHGPAIGLFPDATYGQLSAPMPPGAQYLFYTDGLTETRNAAQDEFSEEGLIASLQAHGGAPLDAMLSAIVVDAAAFGSCEEFEDDVCLLGIRCTPPANHASRVQKF
jgi:sigma-B regulation protein RsbU (phosphoserine phosphatase)